MSRTSRAPAPDHTARSVPSPSAVGLSLLLASVLGAVPLAGQAPDVAPDLAWDSIPGTEVSFAMVWIAPGSFVLGQGEPHEGLEDETPPVTLDVDGFWIGAQEVTHDEFDLFRHRNLDSPVGPGPDVPFDVDAVTRPSPPYEDPAHGMDKAGYPATGMTRLAAARYARWLSLKTGKLYRLPTEAEWEYACKLDREGRGGGEEEALWSEATSDGAYRPAGAGSTGTRGLRNVLGNVAEWVWDDYRADRYGELGHDGSWPLELPLGRGRGSVRGGAFDDPVTELRCENRIPEAAAWKRRDPQIPKSRWWNTDSPHVGFRILRVPGDHSLEEIVDFWERALPE